MAGVTIMAFKRVIGGGLLNALQSLEGLADVSPEQARELSQYLESKGIKAPPGGMPARNRLSDVLLRETGTTRKEFEPQGATESLTQNIVSSVANPMTARGLAGKGAGNLLKRVVGGQLARTGVEQLGAPEPLQTAAQIGTEFALGRKQLSKSGKVPPSLKEHTKESYRKFKATLKENERGTAKPLNEFLKDARSFHLRETDPDILQRADFIVDKIQSNIDKSGNIDIRNAYEIRKSLGQDYSKAPKKLRPYITEAREGLSKVLKAHSPLNPEFGKLWEESSDLYSFGKSNNLIRDFFDTIPFAKFKYAKLTGLPILLDKIESGYKALKNPATKKYYFNLIDAVLKDNPSMAIRSASQLLKDQGNEFEKEQEKSPQWKKIDTQSNQVSPWKKVG